MRELRSVTGTVAVLDRADVDTIFARVFGAA